MDIVLMGEDSGFGGEGHHSVCVALEKGRPTGACLSKASYLCSNKNKI
jgi:hypothetical protein